MPSPADDQRCQGEGARYGRCPGKAQQTREGLPYSAKSASAELLRDRPLPPSAGRQTAFRVASLPDAGPSRGDSNPGFGLLPGLLFHSSDQPKTTLMPDRRTVGRKLLLFTAPGLSAVGGRTAWQCACKAPSRDITTATTSPGNRDASAPS